MVSTNFLTCFNFPSQNSKTFINKGDHKINDGIGGASSNTKEGIMSDNQHGNEEAINHNFNKATNDCGQRKKIVVIA